MSNSHVGSFQVTLTTAGTRKQVFADPFTSAISTLVIKALAGNTGKIYIGDVTVAAANGFELSPGEGVSLDAANPQKLYFDAATSGDKISVFWAGP